MKFNPTDEQARAVLVRMGWHPTNARGLNQQSLRNQLAQLLGSRPERTEFEILRQLGRAWDATELDDLPSACKNADTHSCPHGRN